MSQTASISTLSALDRLQSVYHRHPELFHQDLPSWIEFARLLRPGWKAWHKGLKSYLDVYGPSQYEADLAIIVPALEIAVFYRPSAEQLARHEGHIGHLDGDQVDVLFGHDPWLWNLAKSIWEYAKGEVRLTTYPWNFSVPIADLCNARCIFCTSWLEGRELVTLEQIDALEEPLRRALYVGLVGHGEPMAHPKFGEIAARMKRYLDQRATLYTITNGYFLQDYFDELTDINVMSYSISLNAASAATHEAVMGLGPDGFDRAVRGLRRLAELRRTSRPDLQIYITMVVTAQNVHEVADFVELGNELGVSEIWLRSLLPQSNLLPGLNYHTLAPRLAPDFETHRQRAVEAIQRSTVKVQAEPAMWENDVLSPGLREAVERNPPAFVSRAEAVKMRDVRQRARRLYDEDSRNLRGARKNDPGTLVRHGPDGLSISTASAPYAYAVEIPLVAAEDPQAAGQPYEIDIEVDVSQGELGVGLLDPARNSFIHREMVRAGFAGTLTFVAPQGSATNLVVENGQAEGGVSTGSIRGLFILRKTMGADGAPSYSATAIDPVSLLKVHNAEDPLEDGLNPMGRMPRFACRAVYYNLYINEMFFRVTPCCFMQQVPGFQELRFDGSTEFFEVWNAPAMVELRSRLKDGPLLAACRKCPEKW